MRTRFLTRSGILVVAVTAGLATAGIVATSGATSTVSDATCTSLAGSAKTAPLQNLSATTPTSAGVTFTLTATGCTAPRVDAKAANGPATQAAVTGKLSSPNTLCVLSSSPEPLWGHLVVKWRNAAGAQIRNSEGKVVTDQIYVRLDADGTERYDLTGFATKGPGGGGDVGAEIGLGRLAACGAASTRWSVLSDGTVPTTGETIGSEGSDDDFHLVTPEGTDGETTPTTQVIGTTTPTTQVIGTTTPTTQVIGTTTPTTQVIGTTTPTTQVIGTTTPTTQVIGTTTPPTTPTSVITLP
jgi:hypothetical protein